MAGASRSEEEAEQAASLDLILHAKADLRRVCILVDESCRDQFTASAWAIHGRVLRDVSHQMERYGRAAR